MDKALQKVHELYYNDETDKYSVRTPAHGVYEISKMQFLFAQYEYKKGLKSKVTAYFLWFFLGIFGAHRFYTGDYMKGFLLLLTLGGFIIGWLADGAYIGKRVEEFNEELETDLLTKAIDATKKEKDTGELKKDKTL